MKYFIKSAIINCILILATTICSSQPTGTIKGEIKYPEWKYSVNSKIEIRDISNHSIMQVTKVQENGQFVLRDVPFASYSLEYYEMDILTASIQVMINSSIPQFVILSVKSFKTEEVVVFGDVSDKSATGGSTFYNSEIIENMPAFSNSKQIETVILNSPGTVPDEDGRIHVRGEDAQLQYVIDGIPVYGNQTRIYSSLFNSGYIKSLDFIRGGINSEYGVAASGILNINTKSGFDRPYFAHAYGQTGSFSSNDFGIEAGGNINQKAALFAGYSNNSTDRYLDPISLGDPIHNRGKGQNLFVKADVLIGEKIDLVLLGSYAISNFEIPNSTGISKQDQNQDMTNAMVGFRLNAELNENSVISFLGYARNDIAKITSNGLNRISNPSDSLIALQNDKFFMGGKRENKVFGGAIEYSSHLFDKDNLKAGIGGEAFPIKEYLSLHKA